MYTTSCNVYVCRCEQQEQVMKSDPDHLAGIASSEVKRQQAIFRLAEKIKIERGVCQDTALGIARYKFNNRGKEPPTRQTSTK